MSPSQYCWVKDCEGNSSIENLKFFGYHPRDTVTIYVVAV
jgi:hypothetical protein